MRRAQSELSVESELETNRNGNIVPVPTVHKKPQFTKRPYIANINYCMENILARRAIAVMEQFVDNFSQRVLLIAL